MSRRTAWTVACLISMVVLAIGAVSAPAIAQSHEEGNLTVDVTDGLEPTPTPTPKTTAPPPSPSRGAGPTQNPVPAQITQATIPDPAGADGALGADAAAAGTPLAMSGLSAEAAPSLDPANGSVSLSFVVRNNTRQPISGSALFWIDSVVGLRLADVPDVSVADLQPEETRRVLVRIDGLGQQIVLRAYVTFTPLTPVGGVDLPRMSRNTTFAVPPLFLLSLVSGVGALGGLVWWVAQTGWMRLRWRRLGL